jgi:ubiquinone/menaquinone biosynthesis C-methylase UbiE
MGFTAALYDAVLWRGERRGMREHRAAVLAGARGRTLEIGAGTGLNLPHYPDAVTELVATEPVDAMAVRLERRAAGADRAIQVVAASAEDLPFDDDSFDTVVSTMVICTVEDPDRALAEIRRVLKPDGRVLFLEHGLADDPKVARWQRRLNPVWNPIAVGCNLTRPVREMLVQAGFRIDEVEEYYLPRTPAPVGFQSRGVARAA